MNTQPEALRLAALLDAHQFDEPHAAAAELRRLHAQRDALLEALKRVLDRFNPYAVPGYETNVAAEEKARAAIKAVEETK